MPSYPGLISRMRMELGDQPEVFQTRVQGDGNTITYDIPVGFIDPDTIEAYIVPEEALASTPGAGSRENLTMGTDFTFDSKSGSITLVQRTLAPDEYLFVEGTSVHLFTDQELMIFINDAIALHFGAGGNSPVVKEVHRYRAANGFIRFLNIDSTIYNMSDAEAVPVSIFALIQALWALSNDAVTDIDILSAEGTNIPRTQRFSQLRTQIDALTQRYKELCAIMGVGMYALETLPLRRISLRTGRLVPIFTSREFDDAAYPIRQLPSINHRNEDPNGPPTASMSTGWY